MNILQLACVSFVCLLLWVQTYVTTKTILEWYIGNGPGKHTQNVFKAKFSLVDFMELSFWKAKSPFIKKLFDLLSQ